MLAGSGGDLLGRTVGFLGLARVLRFAGRSEPLVALVDIEDCPQADAADGGEQTALALAQGIDPGESSHDQ